MCGGGTGGLLVWEKDGEHDTEREVIRDREAYSEY